MNTFSQSNTNGYTDEQLAALNSRLSQRLAPFANWRDSDIGMQREDYIELVKRNSEETLAEFDSERNGASS